MSKHKILAHRGVPTLAPENTIANFKKMPEYGINWLETDLGITRDRHVVVMHDDYLDRTTTGSGMLTAIKYDDLRNLSAGSWFNQKFAGSKVPTMEELIKFINTTKMNVNIELKAVVGPHANELADSLVEQFAKILDRIDPSVRVIVSSFNPVMLWKLKNLRPDTELAVLFENYTYNDDWILTMQALDAKIIHPETKGLTRKTVDEIKSYGYEINVWTVDQIDRAKELFSWGVDGVFTNHADSFEKRLDLDR